MGGPIALVRIYLAGSSLPLSLTLSATSWFRLAVLGGWDRPIAPGTREYRVVQNNAHPNSAC